MYICKLSHTETAQQENLRKFTCVAPEGTPSTEGFTPDGCANFVLKNITNYRIEQNQSTA